MPVQAAEELKTCMTVDTGFSCLLLLSVCLFLSVCAQQCNPGDLRALRKGMSLYHSESQLSSLPQRQDATHVVSKPNKTAQATVKPGRGDKYTLVHNVQRS